MSVHSTHSFFSPGFFNEKTSAIPVIQSTVYGHLLRPFGMDGGLDVYATRSELLGIAHAILSAFPDPLDPSEA